jgi:4-amino-4-deoxy-L-arabinose transferase-like glycosyltransferase
MSGIDQDLQISTTGGAPTLPFRESSATKARRAWSDTQTLARARAWLALAPVLALATFLNFYELSREGYGNTYYAAAVKSMLQSWHNFFFVSFDPGGFVTVDKPPLGFWIQTLSAKIFGFHGWSLILPEALAGVASVALIFHLVRRTYGDIAGLVAALVMAVSPVAIASNRSNIVDSLLVFTVLLGAWAVIRATETGKLRWLLLSMLFVGLGFNIKMLEAYLVVPAFFAVYFFGARLRWSTKFWHSLLAVAFLLAISFSWALTVDAIPADQRPFVGSSQNNSELNLILGYNGIERLIPNNWSIFGISGIGFGSGKSGATPPATTQNQTTGSQSNRTANAGGAGGGPGGVSENGQPGILRLVNAQLGGEAGWLLPLALIGLIVGAWQVRPRLPLGRQHQALLLWGGWLLTGAIFFSVAGFFHQYYLIMIAPPIASLCGAGIVSLWHDYRQRKWLGWLLPVVLVAVGAAQIRLLKPYPSYSHWLTPAILILCLVAAIGLIVMRLLPRLQIQRLSLALVSVGLLGLLLAPTAWAADTTLHGSGGLTPRAGPQTSGQAFGGGGFTPPTGLEGRTPPEGFGGFGDVPTGQGGANGQPTGNNAGGAPGDQQVDSAMLKYLLTQQGSTKYLVATTNANSASPIILETGKAVMALGGFTGSDPILTADELSKLVANGTVRFFLLDGAGGGGGGNQGFSPFGTSTTNGQSTGDLQLQANNSGSLTSWVTSTCTAVSSSTWESSGSSQSSTQAGSGSGQLYDCSNVKSGA